MSGDPLPSLRSGEPSLRGSFALAVVIATRNRPDEVRDAIGDVAAQLGPADELVVVDQSDAEPSELLAARLAARPRVRLLRDPGRGLPRARNLGVDATTAPLVWFLDDDVRLRPGALEAHRRIYLDPTVGGAVGGIHEARVRPNARWPTNRVDRAGRVRTRLDGPAKEIETLKGCNMSFRRQALRQAGPFDERYRGTFLLEDADMSTRVARLGWRLWFEPTAAVDHLSARTGGVRVADAFAEERWRFYNTGYFVRRHRGMLSAPPMAGVFGAIALHRAVVWREPRAAARLMRALGEGWRLGHGG